MKITTKLTVGLSCFMLVLIIIVSCRKDLFHEESGSQAGTELSVKDARRYFYKNLRKQKNSIEVSDDGKDHKIYPYWNFAYASKTAKYAFIEVPVISRYQRRELRKPATSANKASAGSKEDQEVLAASLRRLVIYKDQNGKINQRIITYIPDDAYVKRHHYDISHNQIDKLDKDFSGYLQYQDWKGNTLFILKIKNGKSVGRYKAVRRGTKSSGISVKSCTATLVTIWEQDCAEFEADGPDGPTTIEICSDWYIADQYYEDVDCDEDLDCSDPANFNNAECDDGLPDPCGYSYNKNGMRVMTDGCPIIALDSLIKQFCPNTTPQQQATIIATINELKNLDCASKFIYNFFDANNKTFDFCILNDYNGNAHYIPDTQSFTFSSDFTATQPELLEHEFFHAYQDNVYSGGIDSYAHGDPGYVNIEFEQAVISDIIHHTNKAFGLHGTTVQQADYQTWINGITNNLTEYPKLNPNSTDPAEAGKWNSFIANYNAFLSEFNNLSGNPYTSQIISMNPAALITLFNQINPNCP